jgi:glycine/D-amino acid oxidase-like deaminating enzyme
MTVQDLATRSYWLGMDDYAVGPPMGSDQRADVVIAGAGFTGLWTAYRLLKDDPTLNVVVLESEAVGYGASGRNGGFAMTLVSQGLEALVATVGEEKARALHIAVAEAIGEIAQVCADEEIEADLQPNGLFMVSNTPLQDDSVRTEFETAERLGLPGFELLDRDEIQGYIHSETFRCALREETCTLLNPARLVRGLKDAVIRAGGHVYEQTSMTDMEVTPEGVSVETPGGTVHAGTLVLAVNAYGAQIPELRNYLMPLYSYILLSEPLTGEQWARAGWEGREGLEDRRSYLHYVRPTIDGRLMWAGRDAPAHFDGPNPKYDRDEHVFQRLRESFDWTFPQLDDVNFEYQWGGPIAITGRFIPAVGWLEEGRVAYAFGYGGHGVAPTAVAGAAARDLILGRQTEFTDLAIVRQAPMRLGPGWMRHVVSRFTARQTLRQDDAGHPVKTPLALRLLRRISR